MRFLRFVAALLLIAALPIHGWASLGQADACAMEPAAMSAMQDAVDTCCSEAADGTAEAPAPSGADPGQVDLCKTGQACQIGSACYLVPAIAAPRLVELGHGPGWMAAAAPPAHSPPPLWRPPRAL